VQGTVQVEEVVDIHHVLVPQVQEERVLAVQLLEHNEEEVQVHAAPCVQVEIPELLVPEADEALGQLQLEQNTLLLAQDLPAHVQLLLTEILILELVTKRVS